MKGGSGTTSITRYVKALLVAAVGVFALLAVIGNVTDYGTNLKFVQHVMSMDAPRPELADNTINYRAITAEWFHHLAYITIICIEAAIMVTCLLSAAQMIAAGSKSDATFYAAKKWGVVGCFLGLFLWFFGFQAIGGEWFGMWMSLEWNGIPDAVRLTAYIAAVLTILLIGGDRFDQEPSARPQDTPRKGAGTRSRGTFGRRARGKSWGEKLWLVWRARPRV